MSTATVTSKGQITLPKDVREELGLTPGTRIAFDRTESGDIVVRRERRPVMDLAGSLRYDGPPASLEDMDDAIAAGAANEAE